MTREISYGDPFLRLSKDQVRQYSLLKMLRNSWVPSNTERLSALPRNWGLLFGTGNSAPQTTAYLRHAVVQLSWAPRGWILALYFRRGRHISSLTATAFNRV